LPQSVETRVRVVSPRFFDTMGITLRGGRDFADTDRAGAPRVAIVNETIARTIFAGRDPIGVRIGIDAAPGVEIVGIAADSRYGALRDPVPNTVYLVMGQARSFGGERTLHVRTAPGSAGTAAAIRGAVRTLDPNVAVQVTAFDRLVEENVSRERLMATLSGALGALAVALAAVGLYGVIAFGVQRRTREIGIRISLGAAGSSVSWMVARDCFIPVGAGLAAGLAASWWVQRLAARQLFGIAPGDPLTMAAAAGFVITIAALAAYLPARRAARVDPLVALKTE
jgi:predicted permease